MIRYWWCALVAFIAMPLAAASYTTSQSGNWSSASTWGGAGVPGAGDSATVNHVVTLDVDTGVSILTLNNSISGAHSLSISSTGQWNGGTVSGGLSLNVPSGATISLLGFPNLDGSTLTIGGSLNLTSNYYFYMLNNASVVNNGTIDFQGDNGIYISGSVGTIAIHNNGTIKKSGGTGLSQITVPLEANSGSQFQVNSGNFNVSSVTATSASFSVVSGSNLNFSYTGTDTRTFDAATTISGAGNVYWVTGTNTVSCTYNVTGGTNSTGGTTTINSPASLGTLTVTGGTMTVNSAVTLLVPSLVMQGGTLNGTAPISVTNSAMTWTGGTIAGSGALTIPSGTTITLIGFVSYDTRPVTNNGAFVYTSNYYSYLYSGAVFTNNGTIDFQGDGGFYIGGGSDSIVNNGTITKSAGTGNGSIQVPLTLNSGSQLNIQSGTFLLGNVTATGATMSVSSGATAQFYYTTSSTFDAASTISGAGTVLFSAGTNTVSGAYAITGATNSSSGTNSIGSNITSVGNVTVTGGTLTITNSSAPSIGNLTAQGGTLTLNIPTTLSIVNVTMSGGTLNGTASIALTGTSMTWTGGTLGGSGTFTVPAGTTITLNGFVAYDTRAITNNGAFVYSSNYYSYLYSGASFTNNGSVTFLGDGGLYIGSGSPSIVNNGTITKSGGTGQGGIQVTTTLSSGSSLSIQSGTMLLGNITSTGATMSVSSGATAQFYWTTTATFDAASTINGAGTVYFSAGTNTVSASYNVTGATNANGGTTTIGSNITAVGNMTVTGGALTINNSSAPTIGNLTAQGGTLTINIPTTLSIASVVMSGGTLNGTASIALTGAAMTWTGGTLGGSGTFTIPAGTAITINGYVAYDTRAVTNSGTVTYSSNYYSYFYGGASFTNNGTVDFQGDGGFYIGSGSDSVVNNGTIKKSAGTVNGGMQVPYTGQSGSVLQIQSGTMLLGNQTYTGGSLSVTSGATAYFYYTTTSSFDAASSIGGAGNVTFGAGTNTVNATYNVTGTTTQSGGTATLSNVTGMTTLSVSGGTITINGASAINVTTLTFTGGTLGGSAPINITGTSMSWASGTLNGTGAVSIPNTTTITLSYFVFDTRAVTNAGTINVPVVASIYFQNNATLTNSGTIDLQSDAGMYLNSTPGSTAIINSGTFKKSAGTTSTVNVPFTAQSGSQYLVQSGTVLTGTITSTAAAFTVSSGATLDLNASGASSFDAASTISGPGTLEVQGGTTTFAGTITAPVYITGGTLTINSASSQSIPTLIGTGGIFNGSGNVNITSTPMNWGGTTFGGSGTLTISAASVITVDGYPTFDTKPIVNNGSMKFTAGTYITMQANASLTNNGTIDFQSNASILLSGTAGTTTVVNTGTIKKSAGISNSYILVPLAAQSGSQLQVQTGFFNLGAVTSTGGTFTISSGATLFASSNDVRTFDAASTISGAGTFGVQNGTNTFSGTITAPTSVSAGTLAINSASPQTIPTLTFTGGTFGGSANVGVTGASMSWGNVTLNGTGTLSIPAGTTVAFNGYNTIDGKPVSNAGTIQMQSSYYTYLMNNAVLTNSGTIDFVSDGSFFINGTVGTTAIVDSGTMKKSGGTGITQINVPLTVQSGGQFLVQSGSVYFGAVTSTGGTFSLSSGTIADFYTSDSRTFDAASTISGAGTFMNQGGTTTISGTISTPMNLTGGTVAINSASTTTSSLAMAGGTLTGTGTITISGGTPTTWTGGTITGTGTLAIAAGTTINDVGYVYFDGGRNVNVAGTLAIQGGVYIYVQNNAVVNVTGTVDIQGDGGMALNSVAGTTMVNVSGTLKKSGGASGSTMNVPLTVTSGGQVLEQNSNLYLGAVTSTGGAFNAASGTTINFNTNDTRTFDAASTLGGAGTFTWSSGTNTFSGTVTANTTVNGGTLSINSASAQSIPILIMGGGTLTGSAPINVTGSAMTWTGGTVAGSGAFTISAASILSVNGYPFLDTRAFTNNGAIRVIAPVNIYLQNNATLTNNGTIDFQADGSIILNIAPVSMTNNGTIKKTVGSSSSAITLPLTNAAGGTIQAAAGTLQITNTFSNAGTLYFPIAAAASFGKLSFNNALTLGGTLTVTTIGGYAPSNGTAFQIITYPSYSGSFPNKNLDYPSGTFTETYAASNLTVTAGPQALGITGVSPNLGTSAGGTTVTISGVDFTNTSTVTFGGINAASVTFNNSTSLTAVTPPHSVGPADVVVTNPSTSQTATLTSGYLFTGLVSQYSFDDVSGPGKDVAGTNDATNVVGVTQLAGGKVGQMGGFSSGYMDLPAATNLNLRSSNFTLEAWVNSSSTSNGDWFTKATAGNVQQYGLGTVNNTQASFTFDGGAAGNINSITNVFDGTWHHVAAVKRGSGIELWVDGKMESSGSVSGSSDSGAFAIGRTGACCGTFNGDMDEVKISNYALSSTEIRTDALAPDLAITISAPASVTTGQTITWSITVTNNGPVSASNVTVTDLLPAGTSYVSATASQGSCTGTASVTCGLGTLANLGTATVTIVANATTAGNVTNTANVAATEVDPVTANNSASAVTIINSPSCSAPTVTASGPTTFCAGGSVTLTANASGASSYQWYDNTTPIGGATGVSYLATASGSYSVVATFPSSCSAQSAATSVTVHANPPTPTVSAGGPTTFCAGGSVTLTAPAGYTWSWSNGATTQSITVTTSGNYSVTVTDANGCNATSAPMSVTANALPNATITAPASICNNTSGSASVATAAGAASCVWTATNANITSGNGTTSIAFTPTGAGSVGLTVAITDGNGCSANGIATVTVGSFTPAITPTGATTFCQGGSVTLTATAGSSYLWSNGATTQSIVVTSSGTFTVNVTSGGCSGTSSPVTVTVNANPTPTISASGPTTFCQGGSVTLTASPAASYLWSNGATTQSITVTTSGSYSVGETNAAGCGASSAPVSVGVNSAPAVTITGPSSACPGTPVTLDAGAGYTSYNWSNGATTQTITVSPSSTTTFSVAVTNVSGCSASGSKTVTISSAPSTTITAPPAVCANSSGNAASVGVVAGATYSWSISGGSITSGQSTNAISFSAGASGTVTLAVTVSASGCSANGTQSIAINPIPAVTISGPSAVCPSSTFTLDAGAGFSSYQWSTGATTQTITVSQTAQTTYSVAVTSNGCSASASKTVGVTTTGGSVTITAPSTAIANSTGNTASVAAGQAGTTYAWTISGGSITAGQGTPSITWAAGPGTSATIGITETNGGCSASGSATIQLNGSADLAISINAPAAVNTGDAFTYTLSVANNGPTGAKNVTVSDTLPAGVNVSSVLGSGWNCAASGGSVTCTAPQVAVGSATAIMINATAPSSAGSITDSASVSSTTTDPNAANNNASVSTQVNQQAPQCSATPASLTSPADGAVNVTSPVAFSWTAVPNASAYDLAINGSVATTVSTTSASLTVPAGTATWSVTARFSNGCPPVTSATRSFTVSQAANCSHGAAQLIAPAAGSSVTSPVTFQWTAVADAINYRVWVAVDGGAPQDLGLTGGAVTLTHALSGSSFSWFVESLFNGCPSTNSASATFTIPKSDPCANHGIATLTSPPNNSVTGSAVQFAWNAVANASGYRVWANVNNAGFVTLGETTSDTTLNATIASGSIEWYVQTLFDGCAGTESLHGNFTIPAAQNCPPTTATILAPSTGTTLTSTSVPFSWSAAPNAIRYEVWLSLGNAAPALLDTTTSTSLTHSVPAGSLEWFVRAFFNGCPPLDSPHATFTVAPAPNCPQQRPILSSPADGDHIPSPVSFAWSAVPQATQYKVRITTAAGTVDLGPTADTHLDAQTMQAGAVDWSVEAIFGSGCASTRSAAGSFVVIPPVPQCAAPVAPTPRAGSAVSANVDYVISWPRIGNAAFYEYEESTSPTFGDATPVATYADHVTFHHANNGSAPVDWFFRIRTVTQCDSARSLFSPTVVVAVLPSTDTTGATPADDPQPVSYTLNIPTQPGLSFSASANESWISVTPSSGTTTSTTLTLTVTAHTSGLPVGTSTGAVTVVFGASTSGKLGATGSTTASSTVNVSLTSPSSPSTKSAPPPDALIIPAVAHADGINSKFQSDIRVTNTAPDVKKYQLTFTPSGDAGVQSGKQATVSIDPGATLALDDILNTWFGATGAIGTLEIRPMSASTTSTSPSVSTTSSSTVNVTTFAASRTYNTTPNGTYGQFIPAIPFAQFVGSKGSILSLQQIAQSTAYRTNVGIVEGAGEPATVLLSIFGDDGAKLAEFSQALSAGQHLQMNSLLASKNLSVNDGRIEVRVTSPTGKVTAYASVVDNNTNDPLLVSPVAVNSLGANKWVIPGVADLSNGAANWRSDVRLFNAGSTAVNATLTYVPQGGAPSVTKTVAIAPNEVKQFDGVLQSVFGVTNSGGALQITTNASAPLVATARTYNQTTNGTYGQFIPAVTPNDAVGKGQRALQILQVEESNRYRSNIGIAEVSGKPATVEVTAVPPDSKFAVTMQTTLNPNEFRQYGSLIKSLGLSDTYNARVSVRVIDGDGRVTAYASVIDQTTQDPTFVPAE